MYYNKSIFDYFFDLGYLNPNDSKYLRKLPTKRDNRGVYYGVSKLFRSPGTYCNFKSYAVMSKPIMYIPRRTNTYLHFFNFCKKVGLVFKITAQEFIKKYDKKFLTKSDIENNIIFEIVHFDNYYLDTIKKLFIKYRAYKV